MNANNANVVVPRSFGRNEKARQDELEERRQDLEKCAERWRKSQEIRAYLSALEGLIESSKAHATDPEGFPEWLSWAKWYAECLDPLVPNPIREEYVKPPVNLPVDELDLTRHTSEIVEALGVKDAEALHRLDRKTVHAASQGYGWRAWSETAWCSRDSTTM